MSGIKVQEHLDRYQVPGQICLALDVGCGLTSEYYRLPPGAHLLGMDVLESSLLQNGLLYYRVVGDAQALPFKPAQFDIVFCTYVLEHLRDPQQALLGMFEVMKEGGLIVLDFPNLFSLKGLLAKLTPLWFHRWVYRRILSKSELGASNSSPFKTYLHYSMRLERVQELCRTYGLIMLDLETQDARASLKLHSMRLYRIYDLFERLLNRVLGGKLGDSEVTLVFQKPLLMV